MKSKKAWKLLKIQIQIGNRQVIVVTFKCGAFIAVVDSIYDHSNFSDFLSLFRTLSWQAILQFQMMKPIIM